MCSTFKSPLSTWKTLAVSPSSTPSALDELDNDDGDEDPLTGKGQRLGTPTKRKARDAISSPSKRPRTTEAGTLKSIHHQPSSSSTQLSSRYDAPQPRRARPPTSHRLSKPSIGTKRHATNDSDDSDDIIGTSPKDIMAVFYKKNPELQPKPQATGEFQVSVSLSSNSDHSTAKLTTQLLRHRIRAPRSGR
jgi:hypothetical protein